MQTIDKVKQIDIKALIEKETGSGFSKTNQLEKCPFCGSGKGTNQSPAFSIKTKDNFFKCFSCGTGGSTIDFMIALNSGWNEHRAIKYLQEEYLGIKEVFQPSQNNIISAFDKMLYAIKSNPLDKASAYLKSRSIDAKSLPQGSYWYDSHSNAIVFIDANNKLINRRMINPVKGKPKAKNHGTLNESIYDKMFFPDFDVVFLQEGVINALSMIGCSSIALFSTENKIKNPAILQKYIHGKTVILAMDNDDAGNKCAAYYKDFILSNRFEIKSLRRLVLPKKKDANDLLQEKSLIGFLQDFDNYQLLWEDIISKPISKDSDDELRDNEKYSFFKRNGCYYSKEYHKTKPVEKKLSNFLMESVFHLMDGTKESKRLVKFQRNTGEITVNEITSSELNLDRFKKVIRSILGRGLTFFGNTQNLDIIPTYLYDNEKNAIAVNQLGYQHEHGVYCFADAVISKDNALSYPDKLGIVETNAASLYLPPFAYTNLNDKGYSSERKFAYKAGDLNFDSWAELIYKAYGINGAVGISFVILALYRDIILDITGFFPFLFLFGDQGAGKSNFVNFFLYLFGEPNHGISLLNSTDKGFSRSLTQRSNALYYLKEYTNAIDKKTVDVFKTGYDGELYTMAQKSNDNKTTTLEISSACMVDGNELPTSEAALFARMIVLHFEDNKFSEETTEAYKTLLKERDNGFCNVTRELLKYRNHFEKYFKTVFNEVFQQVKTIISNETELADRQIRHIALLLTPVKLLQGRLQFPFDLDTYQEAVIENAKMQDEMASDLKDVTIFWSAFAYKLADPYSDIRKDIHYVKDPIKKILYIKFKLLYPCYTDYVNKNKLHFLEMNSLRELLTAKGNKSFIPNTSQKSRNVKSYTHKILGSSYMFKYEDNPETNGIIIDGVELAI